jgi:hypothetical protein
VSRKPPVHKAGMGCGRRRLAGEVLDVAATAAFLGATEDFVRSRARRGLLPWRRWAGRVVFLRSELSSFLSGLEGVSAEQARANLHAREGI